MPKRTAILRLSSARRPASSARAMLFCCACSALACDATPAYFSTVANQVLRMQGGSRLGGDLNVHAIYQLEQQVKRIMGSDASQGLNVSALRDAPETELLRVLFLAVLGNFTSAAGADWNRPCSLVVDPMTGLVQPQDPPQMETLALKVVLVLLVAVQLRQWVAELSAQRGSSPAGGDALVREHARKGV